MDNYISRWVPTGSFDPFLLWVISLVFVFSGKLPGALVTIIVIEPIILMGVRFSFACLLSFAVAILSLFYVLQ